ncbi:hypothetical protein BV20DRAFT_601308 [Pilatotrama ljubarskyi]|nr:hypothetical protein BV20DRAFT_601308 [Pilatotrama ljubarskyi]
MRASWIASTTAGRRRRIEAAGSPSRGKRANSERWRECAHRVPAAFWRSPLSTVPTWMLLIAAGERQGAARRKWTSYHEQLTPLVMLAEDPHPDHRNIGMDILLPTRPQQHGCLHCAR